MVLRELLQSENIEDIKIAMSVIEEDNEAEVVEFYWITNLIYFVHYQNELSDEINNEIFDKIGNKEWIKIDTEILNLTSKMQDEQYI